MKLRELIEALQSAPPEAFDQDVLIDVPKNIASGCQGIHLVESLRFKSLDGEIRPWQVVIVHLDLLDNDLKLHAQDSRRKYLSDVHEFELAAK